MSLDEFELIKKYFRQEHHNRSDVRVGSGDDCAVLLPPAGQEMVMTIDSMLVGKHFLPSINPADLAYKAVAVSLSDIAAMGAEPAWLLATLSVEMPEENWLAQFAQGLFEILKKSQVALVGGDFTRGPISVTTQITGFVPPGEAILRSGAKIGDKIYVTGTLGDAGLALADQLGKRTLDAQTKAEVYPHLLKPIPRIAEGLALRSLANSAIDISDGLVADLGHIVKQSGVGAKVFVDALPLSPALKTLPTEEALSLALSAGDDYELCFTLPSEHEETLKARMPANTRLSCIGQIVEKPGLDFIQSDGKQYISKQQGYRHF